MHVIAVRDVVANEPSEGRAVEPVDDGRVTRQELLVARVGRKVSFCDFGRLGLVGFTMLGTSPDVEKLTFACGLNRW